MKDYKLYRVRITKRNKEFMFTPLYPESTHLISIEQKIDGDKYYSGPEEIYPSLLRKTINGMLEEIEEMRRNTSRHLV